MRTSSIWWRKSAKQWYTTIDGQQHPLGRTKAEANIAFHKLMAAPPTKDQATNARRTVSDVVDLFLDHVERHKSPSTYEWYRGRLEKFVKTIKSLKVSELKVHHVQKWVDQNKTHSPTTIRNNIQSIKGCLKWALENQYIDNNPIQHMERPEPSNRKQYIDSQEFELLISFVRDKTFKDLLVAAHVTGCRPQEITRVEARHYEKEQRRWLFPIEEAKGKRRYRAVYLPDAAIEITERLIKERPTGPLFVNSKGRAWTKDAVGCQFDRLQIRMAKAAMRAQGLTPKSKITRSLAKKYAKRYCLYDLRHGFATEALKCKVDNVLVGILMGHKDPTMVAKIYQHVDDDHEFLSNQTRRIKRAGQGETDKVKV